MRRPGVGNQEVLILLAAQFADIAGQSEAVGQQLAHFIDSEGRRRQCVLLEEVEDVRRHSGEPSVVATAPATAPSWLCTTATINGP